MSGHALGGPSFEDPAALFQLVDRLGEGSFGEVWSAIERRTGRLVAVKIVRVESGAALVGKSSPLSTLLQEIETLRSVSVGCEHVVRFFGSYVSPSDGLWIVMEMAATSLGDLIDVLPDGGLLTEVQISDVCAQVLLGLAFCHARGVVHRDIKATNLLLTDSGIVKLADFGVAATLTASLSKRRTVVGSPYWMAPEVVAGSPYDSVADIWSTGITALELSEGLPLADVHPMRVLFLIPTRPPPTLAHPEQWSPDFSDFLNACLVKDPAGRATAVDLLAHPFIAPAVDRLQRDGGQSIALADLVDACMPVLAAARAEAAEAAEAEAAAADAAAREAEAATGSARGGTGTGTTTSTGRRRMGSGVGSSSFYGRPRGWSTALLEVGTAGGGTTSGRSWGAGVGGTVLRDQAEGEDEDEEAAESGGGPGGGTVRFRSSDLIALPGVAGASASSARAAVSSWRDVGWGSSLLRGTVQASESASRSQEVVPDFLAAARRDAEASAQRGERTASHLSQFAEAQALALAQRGGSGQAREPVRSAVKADARTLTAGQPFSFAENAAAAAQPARPGSAHASAASIVPQALLGPTGPTPWRRSPPPRRALPALPTLLRRRSSATDPNFHTARSGSDTDSEEERVVDPSELTAPQVEAALAALKARYEADVAALRARLGGQR
jgi:hypothetical protein